jgi:excisionase family DNA binding protein
MNSQLVIAAPNFFENIQVLSDFVRKIKDQDQNKDDLVGVVEASKISKIGKTKIYEMVNNGLIEHKRFGNSIRIIKSSLIKNTRKETV